MHIKKLEAVIPEFVPDCSATRREKSDGCDGAQDCERVSLRVRTRTTQHTKPQGFYNSPPASNYQ
jgi:hypothetical protein